MYTFRQIMLALLIHHKFKIQCLYSLLKSEYFWQLTIQAKSIVMKIIIYNLSDQQAYRKFE